MGQVLHGCATTTEAVRRAIQNSQESLRALARRYGINQKTVAKWKRRETVADLPTGPKKAKSTVLSVEDEAIIVAFRRHTLPPLDDCLYALQPTIPHLTRSSLHRCLQRHGEVISAYQKCVAETVRRFGGFLAKYMGDGVLVYFGCPQAHEDDAERAVRAGLELVAAVTALKARAPLETRVGMATGHVVVGDLIGSGVSQEHGIVGETPNLAARLQSIAEPNSVVFAESTRKLLGNLFELDDLGSKHLKGITGPVRVFAALRPSSVESRFEALHGGGLTEVVGREEELELLMRRWARAKSGEGQVVLLSGAGWRLGSVKTSE